MLTNHTRSVPASSLDLSGLLRFSFAMRWAHLIFCLVQCMEICHKNRHRELALQVWFPWYRNILLGLDDPSPGGLSFASPHKVPPGCTQGRIGFPEAPTSVWRPGIWHFGERSLDWFWLVMTSASWNRTQWRAVKECETASSCSETTSSWVYFVGPGRAVQFA